jgi:glycine oxidase
VRVTVVGAGVAGLTTALALAEGGAEVTVVERGATLGIDACSRYAGGMLAPWCEAESAEPVVTRLGQEALSYWPARHGATKQCGTLVVAPSRDAPDLERFSRRTTGYERMRTGLRRWNPIWPAGFAPPFSSRGKPISIPARRSSRFMTPCGDTVRTSASARNMP